MKPPKPKRIAQAVHRRLRSKLEYLAQKPGTEAEGKAAAKKLKRLLKRYDFTGIDLGSMFDGFKYESSDTAYPLVEIKDPLVSSYVKWAIEESTKLKCIFHGDILIVEATARTADKLKAIALTIYSGMTELWAKFGSFPGVYSTDRGLFLNGLYSGMMNEVRPQGTPLPARIAPSKATRRIKKASVAFAAGLNLHPYSVALELGKQIRFQVPLVEISQQLETMKPKEIQ